MTSNGTSIVNPSEVGWAFVPQYYNYLNKHPNRLHCFYTKSSTFIHGTEGEDGKPSFGQQEIHNQITAIGFQDCKVYINSVDAQSSANGGILIQVIGEMSNRDGPWKKFVQTFFLAEQPNGYFVLNDIFRFLKEETVEDDEANEGEAEQFVPAAPAPEPISAPSAPVPVPPSPTSPPVEHHPEPAVTPTPVPQLAEEVPAPEPVPQPEYKANGIHAPEPQAQPESVPEQESPLSAPEPPATASPPPVPSPKQSQEPLPVQPAPPQPAQPPAPAPAAVPPVAPQPQQPPQKKTWANLAGKDLHKWGSAVANDARGVSEAPASPAPASGPQSPAPRPPHQNVHSSMAAAQSAPNGLCFVKGVTENISADALKATLTRRFGSVKVLDLMPQKACAFLEFAQVESARRAIATSLPTHMGGEGGIRVEGVEGAARVTVELRKDPRDRGAPPRGGAPVNTGGDGRGRGGFRGRGGPGGRGRGGPPPAK